jgi:hypothetical protein
MCSGLTSVLHVAVITKTKTTADDENESRTPSTLLYKQEKILMLIIPFIWLQKVLGLCDRGETGRLEKEKEKNMGRERK